MASLMWAPVSGAQNCDLVSEQSQVVTSVERADTLHLDNGSDVVLIGALSPVNLDQDGSDQTKWEPAERSKAALEALVLGKAVDLAFSGRRLDRYGRQLAHVFVPQGTGRLWVQGELITAGFARAYALPGSDACFDQMIAREQAARDGHFGHWATGVFQDRDASEPRALARFRDTFQTVEGRIARTAKVRGQQVFDFGAADHTGFSLWLAPRSGRRNAASPRLVPEDLVGQRVRIRGWIEVRHGPRITVDDLNQIEILTEVNPSAPPEQGSDGASSQGQPAPIPAIQR